jgi:hypothetical protein
MCADNVSVLAYVFGDPGDSTRLFVGNGFVQESEGISDF